jgi:hypothetical protein
MPTAIDPANPYIPAVFRIQADIDPGERISPDPLLYLDVWDRCKIERTDGVSLRAETSGIDREACRLSQHSGRLRVSARFTLLTLILQLRLFDHVYDLLIST